LERNETPVPLELDAEVVDLIRKLLIKLPILADRDDDVGIAARDLEKALLGFAVAITATDGGGQAMH
jgi:hypothetical protein